MSLIQNSNPISFKSSSLPLDWDAECDIDEEVLSEHSGAYKRATQSPTVCRLLELDLGSEVQKSSAAIKREQYKKCMTDVKSKSVAQSNPCTKPKKENKTLKSEISELLKLLVNEKRKDYQKAISSSAISKVSAQTYDLVTMNDVLKADE